MQGSDYDILPDRFQLRRGYAWKRDSLFATASIRKKSTAATLFDKEDFSLALPGVWQEQPTDDGCEFVNRSTGEMLIVSVLRSHELGGSSEMRPTIERLDAIRRTMLSTVSLSHAILGPTQYRESERNIEARFDGHDPQHGMRVSVVIRGSALKVLTLSLYRDSLIERATPFTVYASLIFNLLKVKGA